MEVLEQRDFTDSCAKYSHEVLNYFCWFLNGAVSEDNFSIFFLTFSIAIPSTFSYGEIEIRVWLRDDVSVSLW